MTKELTTRAHVSQDGAQFPAGWMLKSGQSGEPRGPIATILDGIQFFVSGPEGRVVHLDLDVHDAGDLHQALEAHMENITAAAPITQEERDRLLRKGRERINPESDWEEVRRRNLNAIQEQIDNPLPGKDDLLPRLVYDNGQDFNGFSITLPTEEYRELLAARLDPEFLAAMEEVLEAWTDPGKYPVDHTVARERVHMAHPVLAAALDRLAALNA